MNNDFVINHPIIKLVKPETLWKLDRGIVMVQGKPWQTFPEHNGTWTINVLDQNNNYKVVELLEFISGVKIG